ncbi:patatin-like phospholipase family protein [Nocardioides gilvus]|uniref:patatin-like phospholipase family protein n=1 Tax=Nocardioides gilvus TaxID=1735589 RepID=UPI00194FFAAB|nr:patatin-like phospholipase family protein [Nocardioides gilvus]
MTSPTRISLALGGGGARGYAHIGVIQVLEERGYEIVGISGTSIGALVGGIHAAGQMDTFTDWVTSLTTRDMIRLLDPSLRTPGALKGHRLMARVNELLEDVRIEDLPIPYTAVATDLLARKEVWFQEGPLPMAIRASIALPTLFAPVMLNGRLLADGVMTDPVPIAPLSGLDVDLVVAVDLSGLPTEAGTGARTRTRESSEPRPMSEWQEKFRRTASHMMDNDTVRTLTTWLTTRRSEQEAGDGGEPATISAESESEPVSEDFVRASGFDELPSELGVFDVMELSLDVLQSVVARYRLASYPPDVMITMPKNICKTLDFHRGAELIEIGRTYAEETLANHISLSEATHPETRPEE